jgi:chromosome segregation ATPase
MNDEQQLWRDVQKFMNQFPGFVAIAKKIGELGDLKTWQENEQRKLDALRQEAENQRAAIVAEREAANASAKRSQEEIESQISVHEQWKKDSETAAQSGFETITTSAQSEADKILGEAKAKVKEIIDQMDLMRPKKAALEKEIAALTDDAAAAKREYGTSVAALTAIKDQHASFVSQIVGIAGQ